MYPFGSGTPNAPPNNSSMYPQNMPFGAGFQAPPNQPPYPSQHQNQTTPYPPQGSPYGAPYPPSNGSSYSSHQMPPYPSGAISSNSGSAYPSFGSGLQAPRQQSHSPKPPYPSGGGFQQAYPPTIPAHQQQQCPYPPSSTTYPSYPQSGAPYPQNPGSHFPAHQIGGHNPANTNMASCFSEMRSNMYGSKSSPRSKGTPTVTATSNFDPVKDAHDLRKAMKGFGTDEDTIINIICRRTNEQRQEVQRQFKTHFGKDLIEDIKSETSGNFERLLVALLRPIVDFYVTELNTAMAGIGTDEDVLVEILCTLSNAEIHTIKNAYLRCYGAHLESELKSETSGNFKRLLVSLCTANRDESGRTDVQAAQNDARELLRAGELRVGTDESTFNMILCQRNYQQLKVIFAEYEKMTGHSLEQAIKQEFSGDIMDGLLTIFKCVTNKAEYFASRLHKSMAGIGTNDNQLIRVIVSRCEVDMQDIKVAYERLYGKSLRSWIKGDTSGHYKHALYALIGEQRSS